MAIMQYNSGVVEDVKPRNMMFDDHELLEFFADYAKIRTKRLVEVANSWCVWGEKEHRDPNEFNNLGTRIVGEKIYSPLLIVHDSEMDPDKNLTDKVILRPYKDFKNDLLEYLDMIASEIIEGSEIIR